MPRRCTVGAVYKWGPGEAQGAQRPLRTRKFPRLFAAEGARGARGAFHFRPSNLDFVHDAILDRRDCARRLGRRRPGSTRPLGGGPADARRRGGRSDAGRDRPPPRKAPAEARKPDKPDKNAVDFSVSLASAVGQPLKLNGRDGELTLWGRDRALKIAKLTLAGEVISDPTQKCRIDIVGEQPIEAKSLGRPDGLARYEAEIPVCTFTFDVVEGAALVPAQNAACVFQAADCRASPGGLWGPDAASLADEAKAIEQARAHADDAAARLLKTLAGAAQGQAGSRRRRTRARPTSSRAARRSAATTTRNPTMASALRAWRRRARRG